MGRENILSPIVPGLRSFHSGSFTPWMNTSSLTPWLTPHLGKEELIWLSRARHLSGCCTGDRVTVPQKQEAGSTLLRVLPTPRPGGHSAIGWLLPSSPTRPTGARPPCPWEKAHHAPLVGRKSTGDPHQRLLSAPLAKSKVAILVPVWLSVLCVCPLLVRILKLGTVGLGPQTADAVVECYPFLSIPRDQQSRALFSKLKTLKFVPKPSVAMSHLDLLLFVVQLWSLLTPASLPL